MTQITEEQINQIKSIVTNIMEELNRSSEDHLKLAENFIVLNTILVITSVLEIDLKDYLEAESVRLTKQLEDEIQEQEEGSVQE